MVDGVGFSLLGEVPSILASDVFGRRLIHSCGLEELKGGWKTIDSRKMVMTMRGSIVVVDPVDLVG
jgi:hypothetical protein